jgi:hypothetical protein
VETAKDTRMRTWMLGTLITLPLAAVVPAVAAEKQSWGFVTSGDEVLLVYGVPESEAVTLSFICTPKRRWLTVVTTVLPDKARLGRAATIRLVNGAASLNYAGKIGRDNAESGLHVSAEIAIDPRIYDLLAKGTSVRVEVQAQQASAREAVPLKGMQAPLARMRAACK